MAALRANPELTDKEHQQALTVHESGHMVSAIALGFDPVMMWMTPDRTQHVRGESYVTGTSAAQHALTWIRAGSVAEERVVSSFGYNSRTHPQFFRDCHTSSSRGDNQLIHAMYQRWRDHPNVFVSKERAVRDARTLLYNPRLWEATKELASELMRRGRLNSQDIREVLAPYRVGSTIRERRLEVWSPAELEKDREQRVAGNITRLDSPRGRPRGGTPTAKGRSAQSTLQGTQGRRPALPGQATPGHRNNAAIT
ncbi:hypothetical protein [Nocardiopsis dassonvillei]|uniref:hypothetical protein n=1 Tax=Nocardiopsis dassonvillei TaxID=2014 RepID=UPI00157C069A|nr:hypothetical protein [Nocardiopsis dassonvillei]